MLRQGKLVTRSMDQRFQGRCGALGTPKIAVLSPASALR
jgi:hypothetical protein